MSTPSLPAGHEVAVSNQPFSEPEGAVLSCHSLAEHQETTQANHSLVDHEAARRTPSLPAGSDEPAPLRLRDLFKQKPLHRVRSRVPGEDILFAADDAQIPPDNSLVAYRESELRQLVGLTPEEIRRIHAVKKALDGEVVAPTVTLTNPVG